MKRVFCTSVTILCVFSFALSQSVDSLWSRTYGGSVMEECFAGQPTSDGGYVLAGYTESYGAGGKDFWLVKTNVNGDSVWSKTFGGTQDEMCWTVQQTLDGDYILGGWTQSFGILHKDFWIVKTNSNGDSLWSRTFGGIGDDICWDIQQTDDEGYILGGGSNLEYAAFQDIWLIKTNANGDSLWGRSFGGEYNEYCTSVLQTTDGGYALCGYTNSFGSGNADYWLVKISSNGDSLWSHTYGGSAEDQCNYILETADGGFALVGDSYSFGSGGVDVWLVKTDSNGDSLWSRTFGGSGSDHGNSIQLTIDGGYVIAGKTDSYGSGSFDSWLVRVSANGDSLWSRTFGGINPEVCHSAYQLPDHSYVLGGGTQTFGAGQQDFWLVKTGPDPVLCGSLSGSIGPGTYLVSCNISVESSDTLTIQPGTTLDFLGPYSFTIDGYLEAIGTEEDSIVFSADTSSVADGWRGLRLTRARDTCRFEYCLFEFSKTQNAIDYPDYYGGGVYVWECGPSFENCEFRDNHSLRGGGIDLDRAFGSRLSHCYIHQNTVAHSGAGIHTYQCSPRIYGCRIQANNADGVSAKGGGAKFYYGTPTLESCIVTGNFAHDGGGGICVDNSTVSIIGTTIAVNYTTNDGGGLYLDDPSSLPSLSNSILWNNCSRETTADQIYSRFSTCTTYVECSCIDTNGIEGNGEVVFVANNIFSDPLFCAPELCEAAPTTDGDYTINLCSPCSDFFSGCGLIGALNVGCGNDPAPVEDLVIDDLYPDVKLTWSPVTTAVCGAPQDVDYYLIYFESESLEDWDFLGYTSDTTFTHYGVVQFSDEMFYMLEAYIGSIGALESIPSDVKLNRNDISRLLK